MYVIAATDPQGEILHVYAKVYYKLSDAEHQLHYQNHLKGHRNRIVILVEPIQSTQSDCNTDEAEEHTTLLLERQADDQNPR